MSTLRTTLALLALAALVALLSACAASAAREGSAAPEWLEATPDDEDYLFGRGAGDNLALAQQRARAEIARVFETHVHDWRWDHVQTDTAADPGGDARTTVRTRLGRSLATETERVLHGSEIVALWRDPTSGEHYALARLRRATAAAQVQAHIERVEARAAALHTQAAQTPSPLRALSLLAQGRAAEAELLPLRRDVAILARRDAAPPAPVPSWGFGARLRHALGALELGLEAEPPALMSALGAAADAAGISPVSAASVPPLTLHAQLAAEPTLREQGWYWQRAQLTLSLRSAGQTVRSARWPIKQAGASPALAAQRVQASAEALLRAHLESLLVGEHDAGNKLP